MNLIHRPITPLDHAKKRVGFCPAVNLTSKVAGAARILDINTGGRITQLIEVTESSDPDSKFTTVQLNPRGQQALEALDSGWAWNLGDQAIDIPATLAYYQKMIARDGVREKNMRALAANNHPALREIKSQMVFKRLQA